MKLFILCLLISFKSYAFNKIVNGQNPDPHHPGTFNTVAVVKSADHKIFCTGSIAAKNIIVTAKHCLVDKRLGDFKVFFGPDTNRPENGQYREVQSFQVRYSKDWEIMFPSFDIAYIKLKDEIPDGYLPLPVLTNEKHLSEGLEFHQVGYGNSAANGSVVAGEKFTITTRLKKFIDNARYFKILLFEGETGKGSCHGDSGGPTYTLIDNQWYVVSVTNGFDPILTPKAMTRTGDPDFPYAVKCDKNQNLSTLISGHGKWIEEQSQEILQKEANFVNFDRTTHDSFSTLSKWCEARNFGHPSWNLLKVLIDKHTDSLNDEDALEFYFNCQKISEFLSSRKKIYLDGEFIADSVLGFSNLKLIANLEELSIINVKAPYLALETLKGLEIKSLTMNNNGLTHFAAMELPQLENLGLSQNPITNLSLESHSLKSLKLNRVQLGKIDFKNFSNLKHLELFKREGFFQLQNLTPQLESLRISGDNFENMSFLKNLSNLKSLSLDNGIFKELNLTALKNLEELKLSQIKAFIKWGSLPYLKSASLNSLDLKDLNFLANSPLLKNLNATFNQIENVNSLRALTKLEEINLSANPLINISGLQNSPHLQRMRIFRTPLKNGDIPKTPENCPARGNDVLKRFCSE